MKPRKAGLLLLIMSALMLLAGCASQPQEIPVAVDCPKPPTLDSRLLQPTPTQYLLPPNLQRTAPKQP